MYSNEVSRGDGDYEGETITSYLVDASSSTTSAVGPSATVGASSSKGVTTVHSLLHYNQGLFSVTCGGTIVSNKNEYFCCKLKSTCKTNSHANKHPEFKVNRVFLAASNKSTMRAVKLSECYLETSDLNIEKMEAMITNSNKLIAMEDTELSAIYEFNKFKQAAMQDCSLERKVPLVVSTVDDSKMSLPGVHFGPSLTTFNQGNRREEGQDHIRKEGDINTKVTKLEE